MGARGKAVNPHRRHRVDEFAPGQAADRKRFDPVAEARQSATESRDLLIANLKEASSSMVKRSSKNS